MSEILSPKQAEELIKANSNLEIIDVRNPDEYKVAHIKSAKLIPVSEIDSRLAEISKDKDLLLYCKAGKRSAKAAGILEANSFTRLKEIEGGMDAWLNAKLPSESEQSCPISVTRQVFIVAGLLILTGVILSLTLNPAFIYLSGFVGLGLFFSGITGFCGMQLLLEKMPWNKA